MVPISDKEVAYYATFITGHPEAMPDAQHLAATRAVLEGLAKDDRLGYPPAAHEEIRRLLRGTGHEVDELDDMLATGYTLHDAVTAALAAQDRLVEVIAAAENRSLRAEWALRRAGMPVLGERAGDWFLCGPMFLGELPEGSCGHLPRRPAPDGLGHHHWVPRTDPSCGDASHPAPGDAAGEETWHEFHDGPWGGQRIEIDASPDGHEHLIAHRAEPGVGEWAPADAYPGRSRYVRTGSYGETTVMTWRQA